MNDLDALRVEIDTLYVRDGEGRLLYDNVPGGVPAPLLLICTDPHGRRIVEFGAHFDDARGDVRIQSSPAYLFPDVIPEMVLEEGARVVWSEDAHPDMEAPWAAVFVGDKIVSSCDTVRRGAGFEAGVRTATAFRGRGFAAAATACWARNMRPAGKLLFYSTSHDNTSSQAVARRLGLHWIGTHWAVRAAKEA